MISTVTLTFDLTYTNPATGALEPRGIVTDSTDYAGLGVDLLNTEAKGLGVITFNGDVIVDLTNPAVPAEVMIDLQNWGTLNPGVTPVFYFPLELDLNGNVANGVYTFEYSLRLNTTLTPFTILAIPTANNITVDTTDSWLADFLESGDSITLGNGAGPDQSNVLITSASFLDPNVAIVTSTIILDPSYTDLWFDQTNVQFSGVFTYSGCTQTTADVSFTYDCEVGDNGSWAVANTTTLASNEVISTLNCTVSYPSWTALTPTFNPQVVLTSLPYPSAPNTETPLATGTYTVSLTEQILQTQTDGLILQYSTSTIKEFVVSCSGSLCGLIPCIESLRVAHANELQRNRISKYQVFVDNVLLYYAEAQNYRACGDTANYRATLDLIKTNLDASGCECACCDDNVYYWVSNNSGVSVIDSLVQSFQFRLFNLDPVGPGSPLATNDVTQGVEIGALWENVETGVIYRCADNEAGAAVWELYFEPGGSFTAADIEADILVNLTANNVQGQLDQIDTLAVFDGINGLNKVGNDVRLGGTLDANTTINTDNNRFIFQGDNEPLYLLGGDGSCLTAERQQTANTGVGQNLILLTTTTAGGGANGLGSQIDFRVADSTGSDFTTSKIVSKWTNATNKSSDVTISSVNAGTENVGITLNADGSVTLNEYDGTNQVGSPIYYLGVNNAGLIQKLEIPKVSTFVARLNQSGASAPTVTEIYNDTGLTITSSYVGAGEYQLNTGAPGFDVTKTMVLISNGDIPTITRCPVVTATIVSGRIVIKTKFADTLTLDNEVLKNGYIEVRIYE